ncbi:MAG: gliding motility lipoprotein GldH [Paludibacteraceae bacterium]|nr:gliding motility lipoprotein GldH [Paludibacteraceae bacterium]
MKKVCNLILGMIAIGLSACGGHGVYSEFRSIGQGGWDMNDTLQYRVEWTDTVQPYDVMLYLRHTADYPYQNIWLFVDIVRPDSSVARDTIEFYLADGRGRWLGDGGSIKEMSVIYSDGQTFRQAGAYTYMIRQAMRDTVLAGITDVGISIE